MVYWNTKEVVCAFIGGCFISLATTLNMLYYGRITGLSGAFNTLVKQDKTGGLYWKTCFFTALLTFPVLLSVIFGDFI